MKRIWFTSLLLVLLTALLWWGAFDYHQRRKAVVLSAWTDLEMHMVEEAARAARHWLELRIKEQGIAKDRAEREVLNNFIAPLKLLTNGDAFFYSPRYAIYDPNSDFPEEYREKNIFEIFELKKQSGAYHYEELVAGVMKADTGAAWFVRSPARGREYTAWTSIRLGGEAWTIGLSTPEFEILEYTGLRDDLGRELLWLAIITFLVWAVMFDAWRQHLRNRTVRNQLELKVRERTSQLSDVTEQKMMEMTRTSEARDALRESEGRYRTLVETMNDGLVVANEDGVITFVNGRFAEMTGQTREELVGRPADYFLNNASRKTYLDEQKRSRRGQNDSYELGWIKKGGEQIIFLVSPRPVFDDQGGYRGAIAALTDITVFKRTQMALQKSRDELEARVRERTMELVGANENLRREIADKKKAEEALRLSDRRYTLAARASKTGVWDWNFEDDAFYLDPAVKTILGYRDDEIANDFKSWSLHIHPLDREWVMEEVNAHLEGRTVEYACEHRMVQKNGGVRWMLARGTAIRNEQGEPIRMVGAYMDVTGRKAAEEALRQSEEKYRAILANIEEGYYEVDLAGNLTFFNEQFREMMGLPQGRLMGLNNRSFMDPDVAERAFLVFNKVYTTGVPEKALDWELVGRNGRRLRIEASVSLVRDAKGAAAGFRGIIRDLGKCSETLDP